MSNIFEIIDPLDKKDFEIKSKSAKHLLINKVKFPKHELPKTKIAILGIGESLIDVRKALYEMYCDYNLSISDLGNIALSEKEKLEPILRTLADNNIFTILIGNAVDASSVCLNSLIDNKKISASIVCPSVSQSDFINYILNNKIEHLFNLNVLGYQTYLSDPEVLSKISANYFETIRLGKFREDFRIYEPALRDSHIFSLDIASVKRSEITDSLYSGQNGLYSEEVCLISRHAGISDNLKIANIFCLHKIEKNGQINELLAQIVWHIVDGFAHRTKENMLNNVNGIKKILVNLEHPAEQLVFYHSDVTNRWWMEVQGNSEKNPLIIACCEDDYKIACKHDVPLRWIWYQQKLAKKN
jgi:hypothetical protein